MLLNTPTTAPTSGVDSSCVFFRDNRYDWILTGDNTLGANSLPLTVSGFGSAKEVAEPKIVMSLDHSPRLRKFWTGFGGDINSGAIDPLSNFVWISVSNAHVFGEEEWQYSSLFLKNRLSDIWSSREQGEGLYDLIVSEPRHDVKLEDIPEEIRREFDRFLTGYRGVRPDRSVVELAERLIRAAFCYCDEPEIALDIDGELSFDFRLADNRLILAELAINGLIDASVYDSRNKLLKRMPRTNEKKFLAALKS